MTRVLLVSNGHGEASIADRIAAELHARRPDAQLEHLALVGDGRSAAMRDVGPRRTMPSGGLIAMGNLRNIGRDVRSGLLGLTAAQYRFLRAARGTYDVAVAVGDVYALLMTLAARAPAVFVGTAKSVAVAPYGPVEERVLRRAAACYVRDEATAVRLRKHGVKVDAAANVIVDLFQTPDDATADLAVHGFAPAVALFPGSRGTAYEDARFLLRVVAELASESASLGAVLSIAPGLDAQRFSATAAAGGWQLGGGENRVEFALLDAGRPVVRAWSGALGPVLRRVSLVLGQAGTANEAAAAAGVPVVAFERDRDRKGRWYRRRQRGLLGDALVVLPDDARQAAAGVRALLADPARRERMGEAGRMRMGAPGAAALIADRIAVLAAHD